MREELRIRQQGDLEIGLAQEEQIKANKFFNNLPPKDVSNVNRILTVIDYVAKEYLTSSEVDRIEVLCNASEIKIPVPFFAAYIIGGNLTKEPPRPDLDILVATNMRYFPLNQEWDNMKLEFTGDAMTQPDPRIHERFLKPLLDSMQGHMNFKIFGQLPFPYSLGHIKQKVLVRFQPTHQEERQIDLVYANTGHTRFSSEKDFIELDRDDQNRPLQRMPIYRAFLKGYISPPPVT